MAQDKLSITDNRTGRTYDVPIENGAIASLQKVWRWLEGEGEEVQPPLKSAELEQLDINGAVTWR